MQNPRKEVKTVYFKGSQALNKVVSWLRYFNKRLFESTVGQSERDEVDIFETMDDSVMMFVFAYRQLSG